MTQTVEFLAEAPAALAPGGALARYVGGATKAGTIPLVDLGRLMAEHAYDWLEDLARTHAEIVEAAAARTPDVWLSGISRLDARPWGQAAMMKPLFFARAIVQWLQDNPAVSRLSIVGAPGDVAVHLRDLGAGIAVLPAQAGGDAPAPAGFLRRTVWAWRCLSAVVRNHRGVAPARTDAATLFLAQPVRNVSLRDAVRYFFTSHLDDDTATPAVLLVGPVPRSARGAADGGAACLFDGVTLGEAAGAFLRALLLSLSLRRHFPRHGGRLPATGGGAVFWRRFAGQLGDPGELFLAFIARTRLRRLLARNGTARVVFPYEEKGIERAFLSACREARVASLGYVPHPQHRLIVALQDRAGSTCPKPDGYALCGSAYIDFFRHWAGKDSAPMSVWGSAKGIARSAPPRRRGARPAVLLVISHPEELILLREWLRECPEIATRADLTLRPYPAVDTREQEALIRALRDDHPGIAVSPMRDLESDVAAHDTVAFCATSAGLEAVMQGVIGLFVDLTDGFHINPCFDDCSAFRPSPSAAALAANLAWLAQADEDTLLALHRDQVAAVSRIFAAPDKAAFRHSIRNP